MFPVTFAAPGNIPVKLFIKIKKKTVNKNYWRIGRNDCITFPIKCIEVITNIKVFEKRYKYKQTANKYLFFPVLKADKEGFEPSVFL